MKKPIYRQVRMHRANGVSFLVWRKSVRVAFFGTSECLYCGGAGKVNNVVRHIPLSVPADEVLKIRNKDREPCDTYLASGFISYPQSLRGTK